jgi:Ca2+-binding EF-hand superfamily protein
MAKDYTEAEIKDMKETFYFFDKEGKGLVPEIKVGTIMRLLGVNLKENEIQKLMLEVIVTNDRKINFIAFLKMMNMLRMEESGNREIQGKLSSDHYNIC